MMMPANFSVIAENEMTYVVGGTALTDAVKTFNTNIVTIVGNSFVSKLVGATLGTMFSGNWGGDDGVSLFGDNGTFSVLYKFKKNDKWEDQNTFNKVMTTVGLGAAVYQLGTSNAKTYVGNKKYLASNETGLLK